MQGPSNQTDASHSTTYIVGGGIGGMLLAERLVAHAKQSGEPIPAITIIDQHDTLAGGSSAAYGGFITANSYETVNFTNGEKTRTTLSTPRNQGGWGTHPPTPAEQRWIATAAAHADSPATEKAHERRLYHQFGYGCVGLWQQLFAANPSLADACGYHYASGEHAPGGTLRIYKSSAHKAPETVDAEIDFLQSTGGDGAHTRRLTHAEAQDYCAPAAHRYGDSAQYVIQHGGQMNGQAFCQAMAEHLRAQGCALTFLPATQVRDVEFSHNVPRINGLTVRDVNTGAQRSIGNFTDRFVFATGANAGLWQALGYGSPPIMGVAGTSLTVPIPKGFDGPLPTRPLKFVDGDGGPVIVPMHDADGNRCVRIGGYTAFSGEQPPAKTDAFAEEFLQKQLALLEELYPAIAAHFIAHELGGDRAKLADYAGSWAGARPVTPDNHAILGPVHSSAVTGEPSLATENGYLLTGLGAAGFLGIGAADILAQQMANPTYQPTAPGIRNSNDNQRFLQMLTPDRFNSFRAALPAPARRTI